MSGLLKAKNKTLLGVDISSTSVKLIELGYTHGKYHVEAYSSEKLPSGAVEENNIQNTEIVGAAIAKALKRSRSNCRNAATSVSGAAVITKMIQMDASLNDSEMESQISVEADQYIPYPLHEVAIDFEVQSLNQQNTELADVILAACRKENVEVRTEALDISGIKTAIIDVEAFAIERAFNLVKDQLDINTNTAIIALVDIGAINTILYIIKEEKIIYTREQNFGGQQLTDEIVRKYDMSPDEAEIAKKDSTLPDDYSSSILETFIESTIQQISRSLQFFYSSSEYNDVDAIMLTGGSASITGLTEKVQSKLATTTALANPFNKMSTSRKVNDSEIKKNAPALMIACGLAMRGFD